MAEELKHHWTEADVQALIGQSESIRREYKAGVLFDSGHEKWGEKLSVEVSAFANTEGGDLILGIVEDKKSKPRVASHIDGVSASIGPEQLQHIIADNLSPPLPGIRVHRVRLSTPGDRVVFIVHLPQGSTAYQAKDGKYYGRNEFEVKYLPDHEVRLRMLRQQVAVGQVRVRPIHRLYGNLYSFATEVHNVGQLTLHRFGLDLHFTRDSACPLGENTSKPILEGKAIRLFFEPDQDDGSCRIMPGDCMAFPRDAWYVSLTSGKGIVDTRLRCTWKLFLDDAPPCSGVIDIASMDFGDYQPPLNA